MNKIITATAILLLFSNVACGNLYKDVHNLQAQNDAQQAQIDALRNSLNTQIALFSDDIVGLQQSINMQTIQLATLSSNVQITKIVDPCGDSPGFDEILLVTSSGVVGYFEQGGKRFLATLGAGNYITTDGTHCRFSVSASGAVSF
jgi:hypothetical protein